MCQDLVKILYVWWILIPALSFLFSIWDRLLLCGLGFPGSGSVNQVSSDSVLLVSTLLGAKAWATTPGLASICAQLLLRCTFAVLEDRRVLCLVQSLWSMKNYIRVRSKRNGSCYWLCHLLTYRWGKGPQGCGYFSVTLLIGSRVTLGPHITAFPSLESEWTEVMFAGWVAQHAPAILGGTGKEWSLPSQIICTEDCSLLASFCFTSQVHRCWKCSTLTTASATDDKWSLRTAVASCVPASEQQRKWIWSWYCNLVGLDHEAQNLNRAVRGDRIKSAIRICLWQIGSEDRIVPYWTSSVHCGRPWKCCTEWERPFATHSARPPFPSVNRLWRHNKARKQKAELQTSISDEYRHRNFQQNNSKSNLSIPKNSVLITSQDWLNTVQIENYDTLLA